MLKLVVDNSARLARMEELLKLCCQDITANSLPQDMLDILFLMDLDELEGDMATVMGVGVKGDLRSVA